MVKTTGTIMGLALALTLPTASAIPAPACPEVDSAREMLSRAAATQNDRELQAPRDSTAQQAPEIQKPRGQDTMPPQINEAAALVKEADTDCQAGNTVEASQKAKTAIVLMQHR
jgi:hypothetical protein